MKRSIGEKKIISYLSMFGKFTSPEEIGDNVAGSVKRKVSGIRKLKRNARWARVTCKRLVRIGVLESNHKGEFRYL